MSDLPFDDQTDFENAERGRIDALDPCVVRAGDGRVVWDLTAYSYLDAACPDTVNPSLWRQAQLCAKHGLFQVTDGIYQVRGMDISNMTIIEGDTGVIVIDPLISAETAAASIALYRRNRGDRPVTGVIYTHSHADHFGGVQGVLPGGAGDIPILAPEGFLEHAVSENVYAGGAMNRRAAYMYGAMLDRSPVGQVIVKADPSLRGMGTTLTALLWSGSQLGLVHIGDSRAYLVRDGEMFQITQDHTLVQSLLDDGKITAEEVASHPQRFMLLRALDGGNFEPDLQLREARPGDRYLLCSDGLHQVVAADALARVLLTVTDPDQAAADLIALAIDGGGPDNVSCIVADVVALEEPAQV